MHSQKLFHIMKVIIECLLKKNKSKIIFIKVLSIEIKLIHTNIL